MNLYTWSYVIFCEALCFVAGIFFCLFLLVLLAPKKYVFLCYRMLIEKAYRRNVIQSVNRISNCLKTEGF